ncbi:MAG: hypothetical protein ACUVQZ_09385, partial [Candidatus Caldatribacteriaceae bacterium]
TLDQETITQEREKGREVFDHIPLLRGPVSNFSQVLKDLTSRYERNLSSFPEESDYPLFPSSFP